MNLSIGLKVKKVPLKSKVNETDRLHMSGTIAFITKHCLTLEYEDKTRESFTVADIISPHTFILKVEIDNEWKRLITTKKTEVINT